ncbi:MAG: hypothetical protein Q8Q42_00505 [Nanoarchaeota archaeon]|nr:hypothetical protein [Nanoarchaeota archaeon]
MGIEEWRAKKREKDLERVNKELTKLKESGLQFEKKGDYDVRHVHKSGNGLKVVSLVLVIVLVAGVFVYFSRVSSLEKGNQVLSDQLALKTSELENLSGNVNDLAQKVEEKKNSESELNKENDDLKDINDILKKEKTELDGDIKELKSQIKGLEDDLITQRELVDAYKLCITDDNGDIDMSLSVCSPYL